MPGSYRIIPSRGLVYVRYDGHVALSEAEDIFEDFLRQPEAHPTMKQLVDLSRVTDWERDFARMMAMQAAKAEVFLGTADEFFMILYAPTRKAMEFGRLLTAPWAHVRGVLTSLQTDEAAALSILGQPEQAIADLLKVNIA